MKKGSRIATEIVSASGLAVLLASSAFAAPALQERTWNDRETAAQTRVQRQTGTATTQTQQTQQQDWRTQKTQAQPQQPLQGDRTYVAGRDQGSLDRNRAQTVAPQPQPSFDRNENRGTQYDRNNQVNHGTQYDRNNQVNRGTQYDRNTQYNRGTQYDRNRQYDNRRGATNDRGHANRGYDNSRSYFRNEQHVALDGHIRNYTRENGGYRVYLDRDNCSFWVPETYVRSHGFRIGLGIRFGGIFRDGVVFVDNVGWPGDPFYNDPYYYGARYSAGVVRGVVERVNYETGTAIIQDYATGRLLTVDGRTIDLNYSGEAITDLRPGDDVTLEGNWVGHNFFRAALIDNVR